MAACRTTATRRRLPNPDFSKPPFAKEKDMTDTRFTRRSFVALGTSAAAAFLLAACGGGAASPTSAPAAAAPAAAGAAGAATATEAPPKIVDTPSPTPPTIAQVQVAAGQTKVDWWTPRGGKV